MKSTSGILYFDHFPSKPQCSAVYSHEFVRSIGLQGGRARIADRSENGFHDGCSYIDFNLKLMNVTASGFTHTCLI